VVGLGPLPSRPQRFDLSARGGPSSFRVAAILGLLSPRLWLALGSHHSRFSAKTKRFRQIGNQFRQKINLGPISAEKKKSQTKAHFGRKNTVPKKRLARGATVVEIIAVDDVVVGPRRAGAPPPPAATRQARCEADRPSRLSRLSDRRQAAPPGRGSAYAPAHPAVRRPLSRLLEVQRLAGVGSLGRVACLWRLESVSSFWTGCSLNCFGLVFFSERRRHFQGLWCFPDGGDFQLLRPDQTLRPKRTTIEAPRAVAAQKNG